MSDTSELEKEAEQYIAALLASYDVIPAKPCCDKEGGDLLAFLGLEKGAKFIRVQSKGRTLCGKKQTNVRVPEAYITPDFVLFLYLRTTKEGLGTPYVFFKDDMFRWSQTRPKRKDKDGNSVVRTLSLTPKNCASRLGGCEVSSDRMEELKSKISGTDFAKEWNSLISVSGAHSSTLTMEVASKQIPIGLVEGGGVIVIDESQCPRIVLK